MPNTYENVGVAFIGGGFGGTLAFLGKTATTIDDLDYDAPHIFDTSFILPTLCGALGGSVLALMIINHNYLSHQVSQCMNAVSRTLRLGRENENATLLPIQSPDSARNCTLDT